MNVERQSPQQSPHRRCVSLCRAALATVVPIGALVPLLAAAPALAQEERSSAPSLPDSGGDEAPAAEQDRIQTLEDRMTELTERLRESEELRQKSVSPLSWNGYVDFGFFVPRRQRRRRLGSRHRCHAPVPAVLQLLVDVPGRHPVDRRSTRRGEVADLGDAPGRSPRFDSVNSDGAAGFILNEINLRPRFQLSDRAIMRASVNFVPRTGSDFALGDFVDADLGELEYLLTADGKTSVFVGKTMPVFGIEYKERKSDQRFGITPSLIARYTTGSQLGVKVRSKLLDDWLILAAAVTNNSSTIEMFHFYSEIDKNNWQVPERPRRRQHPGRPPLSQRRTAWRSASRANGAPQDRATDNAGKMWFAGVDLQYLGVELRASRGSSSRARRPATRTDRGRLGPAPQPVRATSSSTGSCSRSSASYARVENRDALVTLGNERIYITKEWRATGGVRVGRQPAHGRQGRVPAQRRVRRHQPSSATTSSPARWCCSSDHATAANTRVRRKTCISTRLFRLSRSVA